MTWSSNTNSIGSSGTEDNVIIIIDDDNDRNDSKGNINL